MIGLFDSGLGGLTVVRRVRERLPFADLVFFSDQAHVPYGERTHDDLHHLLTQNLAWLESRNPEVIVMACNTSCAIADLYGWPATKAKVFDIIDSAAIATEQTGARRIGVVATSATVRTGAYARRIGAHIPGCSVFEVAAPALVPLVEAGNVEGDVARSAVEDVCAKLPVGLDAVVLACTHYPILDAHFASVLGDAVTRIDPAYMQAQRVEDFLERRGSLRETGSTEFFTNGDDERFRTSISRIMAPQSQV